MQNVIIKSNPKDQLVIKCWIVAMLALGFVVSVTIPKLAISKLGELGYGVYGLIVGFSGILAFADLGLIPGLTRELAKPLATGEQVHVEAVLRRLDRLVLGLSLCLASACLILMYYSIPVFNKQAVHALVIFSVATFYTCRADIRAALLRVSGAIVESYILRGLYLVVYLTTVVALYYFVDRWNGIALVCYAQLLAAVVYYTFIKNSLGRHLVASSLSKGESAASADTANFWKEAWRVSSPERLNRVIQLTVSAIERPLLIVTAGLAMVTSYDLLMRLLMFVSAVPGALSQPLQAMLLHDSVRPQSSRRFPMALRLTKIVGALCAVAGLIVAVVILVFFHQALFHVPSRLPLFVGVLLAVVAAVNVQTAPGSAALLAKGVVGPISRKLYVETSGVVLGFIAALWLRDGLVFIVVRNAALGLSAVGFLLAEKHWRDG
jgi:hypothetical protein